MLVRNWPALSRRYTAVHESGVRKLSLIRNVCIHSTESETAESAASWFANPASEGSAHIVLGNYAGFRCLNDNQIPWAAPPLNTNGFHIEIVGYAEFSRTDWESHKRSIQWAAYWTAISCIRYDIPVVWCNKAMLLEREPGITAHFVVSDAFHLSTHTDPGPDFPYSEFMNWTKEYHNLLKNSVKQLV